MDSLSIFNVIGPIMIGPSSSHTAGAVRIANTARKMVPSGFKKLRFDLHGSFASTYMGHGTDRALIAGCLGLEPDDEGIIQAYNLAKKNNIEVEFKKKNIINAHPNTVVINFYYPDGKKQSITGISTGGGQFKIVNINGAQVDLSGYNPTLIFEYSDRKGVISWISTILAERGYSIVTIKNEIQNNRVILIMEIDKKLSEEDYLTIKNKCPLTQVSYIEF